jgi:hypothetical protein
MGGEDENPLGGQVARLVRDELVFCHGRAILFTFEEV